MTVLFADLVGFTPFAEERDAEDVRETLQRYSDLARQVVERYGGTVEKFIGDAVMAVWGTPTAHEDDAERAVRAALDLTDTVKALGPQIQARAGVMTGEAAVNMAATDQSMLAGDLVNTAARLQSVAPAGSVLVGESTMRAASAALAFESIGEQTLKGKQAPVATWRALRVVAQRRGAGRSDALETPFVGRDEEFRILREQLHLTARDARTRLVSVTGPAGIGKSRLAWELEKYIDGVVERIYWQRGRCPAYGEGVTFWALGEMVRQRCRLAETDDDATSRQRVSETVDEYVSDDERPWIAAALLALLGLDTAPQGGREMLFAAWRRFFEHIAARGTTVLVFEDLHWADSGLLDFVDHLLDWSKDAPLLVVTLARPELFDRRPNWGAGRRTLTAVALDPLPEQHMRQLLAGLVPNLPEPAVRTIVQRADGIPLYAVETVRMLLADGRLEQADGTYRPTRALGDLEVPQSLRSLITSRLDALDAIDRGLLQHASVLGQSFTLDAAAAVSEVERSELEQRLRHLVRRELLTLEADPRSPERGQYSFMQSLTREVAYSTLSRPERRARHLAAARHYEASGGGDEIAGILAGHYLAAHESSSPGPEADAVAAQARVALRGAADRAAALGSHEQAADYVAQARTVTAEPRDQAALLEREAVEADLAGRYDRAEAAARAAVALYVELRDGEGVARSRTALGTVLIHAQRIPAAIGELEPAIAELPDDADARVRADVLAKLARAYYRNLDPERSVAMADRALELAERHSLLQTIADAMVSRGTALSMLTRNQEAIVLLRGGVDLARREGDTPTALRGAANLAHLVANFHTVEEGMAIAREALELARKVGDLGQIVWQLGNVAIGSAHLGLPLGPVLAELDETLALDLDPADRLQLMERRFTPAAWSGLDVGREIDAFLETTKKGSDPQMEGTAHEIKGHWALVRAEYREASDQFELEAEIRPDYGGMSSAAFAAAMDRDVSRARMVLAKAEDLPVVGRRDEAFRMASHAMIAALESRHDQAVASFRDALRRLRETHDRLTLTLVALGMVRVLGPDVPEARAAAEEALEIAEHMGAVPLIAQLRAAMDERNEEGNAERGQIRGAEAPIEA